MTTANVWTGKVVILPAAKECGCAKENGGKNSGDKVDPNHNIYHIWNELTLNSYIQEE